MQLTLTPDIASALIQEAEKLGTTPELLALSYLQQQFVETDCSDISQEMSNSGILSLADFLDGYIGILASNENVPENTNVMEQTGQAFAQHLLRKRSQGKL